MRRAGLLLLLAALAACMPERRDEATGAGTGEDGAVGQDATLAELGQDATATDAAGDAKSDAAADARRVGEVLARGCTGDGDCQAVIASPCHQAKCDVATGLCSAAPLPDGTTCTDAANLCVVTAGCQTGLCLAKDVTSCDDANPCTQDECKPADGCKHTGVTAPCNDGNPCTGNDACGNGACSGKPVQCDDFLDQDKKLPNACTSDACTANVGCVHLAAGATVVCDDGKACTENDGCATGQCAGVEKVCGDEDKNPCTLEKCIEAQKKCLTSPVTGDYFVPCDDGDKCTTADQCAGAACKGKAGCDDANPCTKDACDADAGCTHAADPSATCASDDVCQTATGCGNDGKCQTAPKDCDDGNTCTDDACLSKKGCTHTANSAACSDGDPCTESDGCLAGSCSAGEAAKCNDGDPCTDDACAAGKGCTVKASAAGTACKAGGGHECVAGTCVAKADCGDGMCALAEDPSSCVADCPTAGGACEKSDVKCVDACVAAKCPTQKANCDKDGGCVGLRACVTACPDAKCEQACFADAVASAVAPFLSANQCSQAFCLADAWIGKKCKGGGPSYVQCVTACESAMCKLQWAACYATAGCPAVRDCLGPCGEDATCKTECKKQGTTPELTAMGDLDFCSSNHCQ